MKRIVVVTVGKTHSGKTTFAKQLESQLENSVVIDQDNHASFLNAHYMFLQPKEGPNKLKFAITQTIIDYAVNQTTCHLILSNCNLFRQGRMSLLDKFRSKGFVTILVYFDLPIALLRLRVKESQRSKDIFRRASSFEEVLERQLKSEESAPQITEADHLFVVKSSEEVPAILKHITELTELT